MNFSQLLNNLNLRAKISWLQVRFPSGTRECFSQQNRMSACAMKMMRCELWKVIWYFEVQQIDGKNMQWAQRDGNVWELSGEIKSKKRRAGLLIDRKKSNK